ncbi:MAG: hypothetical protein ABIA93_04835 [Candidatus Woesearchaeota archaeon]
MSDDNPNVSSATLVVLVLLTVVVSTISTFTVTMKVLSEPQNQNTAGATAAQGKVQFGIKEAPLPPATQNGKVSLTIENTKAP